MTVGKEMIAGLTVPSWLSWRLSRTIMRLGQATGAAAAPAKQRNVDLPLVPAERLRAAPVKWHVLLERPMSQDLGACVERE